MTQEEKINSVLMDICGRLPYGVITRNCKNNFDVPANLLPDVIGIKMLIAEYDLKPYLRPMSSMTEEEKEELKDICTMYNGNPDSTYEFFGIEIFNISRYGTEFESNYMALDWLNKKGFDYRGLIPMGLALETTEDMYK
jgi:hypothetical protein